MGILKMIWFTSTVPMWSFFKTANLKKKLLISKKSARRKP